MVCLTLTNRNKHSVNSSVCIDLLRKRCLFASHEEISLAQLLADPDFSHPLLLETPPTCINNRYSFTYQTIDALFTAGVFVYAALLHTSQPQDCYFKIMPAASFFPSHPIEPIFFSASSKHAATQTLSIAVLEKLIQELNTRSFIFSDDTLINSEFSIGQLPDRVDGDNLYLTSSQRTALLAHKATLRQFELRYIHPLVGLGVYARTMIKKGEIIANYSGIKKTADTSCSNYLFSLPQDCLNMELDAENHGNIARFINHAPTDCAPNRQILTANVVADNQLSNGLQWVVYYAQRDIAVGEQLLVCYGANYFKNQKARGFLVTGAIVNDQGKILKPNKSQLLKQYRIMASHGIKGAQYRLLSRMALIIAAIILVVLSLNWLML